MTTDNEQSAPRRRRSSPRKPAADRAAVLETTEQAVPRVIFSSSAINAPGEPETAAEAAPAKPSRGRAPRRSAAATAVTAGPATIAAEHQAENGPSGEA
jgi:hypothetical protein